MFVSMVYDGTRAKDWVLVKADVVGDKGYRYRVNGVEYLGDRLGTLRFGTSDVDDTDARIADILERGRAEKRPITVFVNPDNPSESMVDREIRWMMLLFLTPFILGFGGVGIGALVVMAKILREPETKGGKGRKANRKQIAAASVQSAASGAGGLWFFAIMWNAIAFPIAILTVPQAIAQGEWLALLVLLFPLIGLLVLWGAIVATFARLRRGRADFRIATSVPRVGAPLEGHVEFVHGVKAGETFNVKLVCERTFRNAEDTTTSPHWTRSVTAKAVAGPAGMRVPFRIEIPGNLPATDPDGEDDKPVTYRWHVEVEPARQRMPVPYKHDVRIEKPAFDAPAAPQAPAKIDPSLEQVLGRFNPTGLTPHQREAFAQLTAGQQAKVARVLAFIPAGKKIIIAIVCLWVAVEVGPMIYSLVR
jgi:hypothetical protein